MGRLPRRDQLRNIPGLSEKIYRQAVPFLRVRGAENPLDETGISPQAYPIVEKILSSAGVTAAEALERPEALDNLNLEEFEDAQYPVEVLRAIVSGVQTRRFEIREESSSLPRRSSSRVFHSRNSRSA